MNHKTAGSSVSFAPQAEIGNKIRTYQCRMCQQSFTDKAESVQHNRVEHSDNESKPYKCNTCGKGFASSSYLSQHNRIHQGIRPYRCERCHKCFTQLSHKQQHLRTHTGEKPYKCKSVGCDKAFSQLSNLQSHSRQHQTDKPHHCSSCPKCFTSAEELEAHNIRHTAANKSRIFKCPQCDRAYTNELHLTRHLQKHGIKAEYGSGMIRVNAANSASTVDVPPVLPLHSSTPLVSPAPTISAPPLTPATLPEFQFPPTTSNANIKLPPKLWLRSVSMFESTSPSVKRESLSPPRLEPQCDPALLNQHDDYPADKQQSDRKATTLSLLQQSFPEHYESMSKRLKQELPFTDPPPGTSTTDNDTTGDKPSCSYSTVDGCNLLTAFDVPFPPNRNHDSSHVVDNIPQGTVRLLRYPRVVGLRPHYLVKTSTNI